MSHVTKQRRACRKLTEIQYFVCTFYTNDMDKFFGTIHEFSFRIM